MWLREWDLDDAMYTAMCLGSLRRAKEELANARCDLARINCPDDEYRHEIVELMMRIDGIDGLMDTLKGIEEDARKVLFKGPKCVYKRETP